MRLYNAYGEQQYLKRVVQLSKRTVLTMFAFAEPVFLSSVRHPLLWGFFVEHLAGIFKCPE